MSAQQCATSWSPEQLDFFTFCSDNPTASVFLNAVAGSGKTTTIVEFARRTEKFHKTLFLAFNKDIAETLKARLPYWVEASTFHSFCNDALGRHLGKKPRVDSRRCAAMLRELVPAYADRRDIEDDVLTLVSRCKSAGYACDGLGHSIFDVTDHHSINLDTYGIDLAVQILHKCQADRNPQSIDFDDMLWLTLLFNVPFSPVHTVVVDEAQDTNSVQREILCRLLNPGAKRQQNREAAMDEETRMIERAQPDYRIPLPTRRLIAVGDPHQSIYGFRGADANAIGEMVKLFSMTELPLSVSWRCSQRVVEEARRYLTHNLS